MDDETKQPEPKANESSANDIHFDTYKENKLDITQAVEPFGQATGLPIEPAPQEPGPSLELNPPTPGGQVSPPLREQGDQTQDLREQFMEKMRVRDAFNARARKADRSHDDRDR